MAIETLRPDGVGYETSIDYQYPTSTYHWDKVNDRGPVADDDTYVFTQSATYQRDLYALPAHAGEGTINSVTVYIRVAGGDADQVFAKPSLRNGGITTDGNEIGVASALFAVYSQQWDTNPSDSAAWEWSDIDDLQIGVVLKNLLPGSYSIRCSHIYVEVDYTPEPPTVTTQAVGTIVPGGATLNGNITDDGGASITQHGFCWKAGSDPVNIAGADGSSELGAGAEGAFDQAKTGLTENTEFYYRAYAINSADTSYGAAQSWTTGETLSGVVAVSSAQSMAIVVALSASGSIGINSASVLSALQALKAVGSVDVSQAVTMTALQTLILSSSLVAISQAASLSLVGEIGKHYAVCAITSAATTVQSGGLIASGVSEIETGTEASVSSSAIMQAITGITTSAELSAEAHRLLSAIIAMTAACSLSALIVSVEYGVVEITTSSSLTAAAILYIAKVLGYTGTLTADDVLVIDCDKMTMKKNGVEDRENHSDDFWHLFVGDSEIVWTDSEGARTIKLEIVHSPRYL